MNNDRNTNNKKGSRNFIMKFNNETKILKMKIL